ncbi:MAG: glutaminase A [Myxococcota bacterium]
MTDAIRTALADALAAALPLQDGRTAQYIPELASVDPERTAAAVALPDGTHLAAGDADHRFTLQSSAKLVLLCGLLEERGPDAVFEVVGTEPTGGSFASVGELEWRGPKPANPLINAGAIALTAQLAGGLEDRIGWIEAWAERLCGERLPVHQRVWVSERRTGHRNRAIAHLLKGAGTHQGSVDEVLEAYFALCSLEATVAHAARFGAVLASGGLDPDGTRILSPSTAATVVALMATCGMYDESGAHLVATGLPAKSGVSGVIVAVAPGRAGIAVFSPRLTANGGSVRGHAMLRLLSSRLGWHVALPGPPAP